MDLDIDDPGHRHLFHIPPAEGGDHPEVAYFAGNSLGLQPKATRVELMEDLAEWARLGVEGHLDAARPWLPYHELLTAPAARLVGALPSEVVVMNSLTVNLHLLMVSFYRPAGRRTRIVIEDAAFPSDSYAVRSQARFHGLDPDETVVRLKPRDGEDTLRTEDVLDAVTDEVALVMLGGVNYLTGELMDIAAITAEARKRGAVVGWDLAHAAGNVPLNLHEAGADFAAWCSYKYLNSGPGALAGVFVHERHHGDDGLNRFEGWWSTEPATRFEMTPTSRPPRSADAWQVSNPPIFAMGPVRTSLRIFDEVGMPALRERSLRLTGYLRGLFDEVVATRPLSVLTPREPERHGCQLSVRLHEGNAGALTKRLRFEHGVIADARQPDVIRFAPVPLYSTYEDCRRAADALAACVEEIR
ncbi:kynureninase [Paractinoplanes rhizophilus]|uniref:Kynureninase n=1 Tax=Paractinoplanes rhizophilus TaxID=1416877 RepID=A0ABW2HUD9_9ACTN|nr:kynureninase [Actinoplanes sp.]